MKEWFESAMVMVDHVTRGIAWGDPNKGFAITYINASGRTILTPGIATTRDGTLIRNEEFAFSKYSRVACVTLGGCLDAGGGFFA